MTKIYRYELRRLVISKLFAGILLISIFYSWQILRRETLSGVARTAPFSSWSYGAFLARTMILPLLTALLFLARLYSQREQQVQALISTTSADPRLYCLIRCAAILTAVLLMAAAVILTSMFFYLYAFRWNYFQMFWKNLLPPIPLVLFPALVLVFGAGLWGGRVHPALPYLLILALLALSLFSPSLELLGLSYFQEYPLTLPLEAGGEPAFAISLWMTLSRVAMMALGAAGFMMGLPKKNRSR